MVDPRACVSNVGPLSDISDDANMSRRKQDQKNKKNKLKQKDRAKVECGGFSNDLPKSGEEERQ